MSKPQGTSLEVGRILGILAVFLFLFLLLGPEHRTNARGLVCDMVGVNRDVESSKSCLIDVERLGAMSQDRVHDIKKIVCF